MQKTVRSLLADAGIDLAHGSWPEARVLFYQEDHITLANFKAPHHPLPDVDD